MSYGLPEANTVTAIPSVGSPVNLSGRIADLQFSRQASGGDHELRFTIRDYPAHSDVLFARATKFVIADGVGNHWIGRMEVPSGEYAKNLGILRPTIRGYGSSAGDDCYIVAKVFTAGTLVESIFQTVRDDLCPKIGSDNSLIAATGRVLDADSEDFIGHNAQAIWQRVMQLGSSSGEPLAWRVRLPDAGGTTPLLELRARPTAWKYKTRMDLGAIPRVRGDLQTVWNRIALKTADEDGTIVTAEDAGSQSDLDNTRRTKYLGTGFASTTDAQAAANQMVARLGQMQTVGDSIVIPFPQRVEDNLGNQIPLWRVLPGEIILIEDLSSGDALIGNEVYIVSTQWDEARRQLTISTAPRHGLLDIVARGLAKKDPLEDPPAWTPPDFIGIYPSRELPPAEQKYDLPPVMGDSPLYASSKHSHGTPNGDISFTIHLDQRPDELTVPQDGHFGLIQGTITSWKLRGVGTVSFQVTLPTGGFVASGGDGASGSVQVEMATNTEGFWELQSQAGSTNIDLILTGTRNLLITDPPEP